MTFMRPKELKHIGRFVRTLNDARYLLEAAGMSFAPEDRMTVCDELGNELGDIDDEDGEFVFWASKGRPE